jgi:ORF6N domain
MPKPPQSLIPAERIERAILQFRGERVMLDSDLAGLYGVETRVLVQAVKRNRDRFPPDFAFQLTAQELMNLRSQIVISKSAGAGGRRYSPWVFTEQGVAMLSSVLHSDRAIRVNLEIMRAFVRLRQLLSNNAELAKRLDELERNYDKQFAVVFDAIRQLMKPPAKPQTEMGYHTLVERKS